MKRISLLFLALAMVATSALAKEFKYVETPDFFEKNPGGEPLGPCHGGAVIDKKGNIYISTDTPRGILEFTSEGKFIRSFGPPRLHDLELRKEKGVEYLYAARPADHECVKVAMDGSILWHIHYPQESGLYKKEDAFKPCAMTIGPDGSIYIADGYGENYILKYDKDRKFVKAFGGTGTEIGKFKQCHGIGLDTRGHKPLLLICNRANNRVEYWDLDGNFVRVVRDDLRLPSKISFHGDYVVIPELAGRVTVLDKKGNIVAQVGDNPDVKERANYGVPPEKWSIGICNAPHGAVMDKHGNLIVAEWSKYGHLHMFTLQK